MPDVFDKLKAMPESEREKVEIAFSDWLMDPDSIGFVPPEMRKLLREIKEECAYDVKVAWPVTWKERHIDFPDRPAPDGRGPDHRWGSVQLFILQPDERMRWHCTREDRYANGPGIMVVQMDCNGISQNEYDAHDPRVWAWIGRLAVIGARTCMKEGFHYDSKKADEFVNG